MYKKLKTILLKLNVQEQLELKAKLNDISLKRVAINKRWRNYRFYWMTRICTSLLHFFRASWIVMKEIWRSISEVVLKFLNFHLTQGIACESNTTRVLETNNDYFFLSVVFFLFYRYKYSTYNAKWQVNGMVSTITRRERIPFHLKLCENCTEASLRKWLKYDIIYPVHASHHNLVICGWFFPKIPIRSKARSRTEFVILLWLEIKKQFETITMSWCSGTGGERHCVTNQ